MAYTPEYPIHDSQFFDVREWVDEKVWDARGIMAAQLIEPRQVRIADLLRKLSGLSCVINNWHFWNYGRKYRSSGFRAKWDSTGSELSQHRRGCAADHKLDGLTGAQMLEVVMDNKSAFLEAGLTTIEDVAFTPTWLHLDSRPKIYGVHPADDFLIVRP